MSISEQLSNQIIAKTLVWKSVGGFEESFFLLVLPLGRYVYEQKVENHLGRKLRLVSRDTAETVTGQKIGSISPFYKNSLEVIKNCRILIDESLTRSNCRIRFTDSSLSNSKPVDNSEDTSSSKHDFLNLSSQELLELTRGEILDFSTSLPISSPANTPTQILEKRSKGPDNHILFFNPSQLRKIAMTSDYAKMLQILSSLKHQHFHPTYHFPDSFSISDHINVASKNGGKTAIQLACWKGSLPIIKLLVEWGGNLNQYSTNENNYGKTAIFYAITQCRDDVVQYLLTEHNPNLLIVNNKGQTPLSLAITHLQEESIRMIEERERLQITSQLYHWINFRDSEYRGKGIFGDLDPRFLTSEQYESMIEFLRNRTNYPTEGTEGNYIAEYEKYVNLSERSVAALSQILLNTTEEGKTLTETSTKRIVPVFPTNMDTRRNMRSVYIQQELHTQLEKDENLQNFNFIQSSTASSVIAKNPSRKQTAKEQRYLREKAKEEEKALLQEFRADTLDPERILMSSSDQINLDHFGPITLQGIITAKRQLSNKLVFLNLSPRSTLENSTVAMSPFLLRYSWKASSDRESSQGRYAIQLILGKTLRMELEQYYGTINNSREDNSIAWNGTQVMEKLCKVIKVGQVIEVDGEVKTVQERSKGILPVMINSSIETTDGDDGNDNNTFYEVEMIVRRLRFVGVELLPLEVLSSSASLSRTDRDSNASHIDSSRNELIGNTSLLSQLSSGKQEKDLPNRNQSEVETKDTVEYLSLDNLSSAITSMHLPGHYSPQSIIPQILSIYLVDPFHFQHVEYCIASIQSLLSLVSTEIPIIQGNNVIGIDCEWKPDHYEYLIRQKNDHTLSVETEDIVPIDNRSVATTTRREMSRVELMQVSTVYGIFLLDMRQLFDNTGMEIDQNWRMLADSLRVLLSHPGIIKIGFELQQDLEKVLLSYPQVFFPEMKPLSSSADPITNVGSYRIPSIVDLHALAKIFIHSLNQTSKSRGGVKDSNTTSSIDSFKGSKPLIHRWQNLTKTSYNSLSKLSRLVLGKGIDKEQQCSGWHLRPFTSPQMEYAALDAAVLLELWQKLIIEIEDFQSHHPPHSHPHHPHHSHHPSLPPVMTFLQTHHLLLNMKFQFFTNPQWIHNYCLFYNYSNDEQRFARKRPNNHRFAYHSLLVFEKWYLPNPEPDFPLQYSWMHLDTEKFKSDNESFSPNNVISSNDSITSQHHLENRTETIITLHDHIDAEEYRREFIGVSLGKSKDDCLHYLKQWYYPQLSLSTASASPSLSIVKQNGFMVVNHSHVLLFINLLSPLPFYPSQGSKTSSSLPRYCNYFTPTGQYFDFFLFEKQYQDYLNPQRFDLRFHLFLRPAETRGFFYAGHCRLLSPVDRNEEIFHHLTEVGIAENRIHQRIIPFNQIPFQQVFFALEDFSSHLQHHSYYQSLITKHREAWERLKVVSRGKETTK